MGCSVMQHLHVMFLCFYGFCLLGSVSGKEHISDLNTGGNQHYVKLIPPRNVEYSAMDRFCFSVAICYKAIVILTSDDAAMWIEARDKYEIVIGQSDNSESFIKGKGGVLARAFHDRRENPPLTCAEFRSFVVSWAGGALKLTAVQNRTANSPQGTVAVSDLLVYGRAPAFPIVSIFVGSLMNPAVWRPDFACHMLTRTQGSVETTSTVLKMGTTFDTATTERPAVDTHQPRAQTVELSLSTGASASITTSHRSPVTISATTVKSEASTVEPPKHTTALATTTTTLGWITHAPRRTTTSATLATEHPRLRTTSEMPTAEAATKIPDIPPRTSATPTAASWVTTPTLGDLTTTPSTPQTTRTTPENVRKTSLATLPGHAKTTKQKEKTPPSSLVDTTEYLTMKSAVTTRAPDILDTTPVVIVRTPGISDATAAVTTRPSDKQDTAPPVAIRTPDSLATTPVVTTRTPDNLATTPVVTKKTPESLATTPVVTTKTHNNLVTTPAATNITPGNLITTPAPTTRTPENIATTAVFSTTTPNNVATTTPAATTTTTTQMTKKTTTTTQSSRKLHAASCSCRCMFPGPSPPIRDNHRHAFAQLLIPANVTSAHRRRRSSAEDKRVSSTTIGAAGILTVIVPFVALFVSDVICIFRSLYAVAVSPGRGMHDSA